ncbi:single-stranded DNA-binding protein [Candidatus Daviesbacteria bacterium]|nr:single-stranded DNA-binding protein [Candidatus Daviesbacteria bacterium]
MASRSWNRVELIGNLTRDPELRYTPNGAAVCTFGLATNRTYVSEGEKKEDVDFHRLVAWNKLAELCNQLLKKGTKVFISGRLQTRSWEAQDGTTRQTTEIVVEDMILLTPKQVHEAQEEPAEKTSEVPPAEKASKETSPQEEVKEDLPF